MTCKDCVRCGICRCDVYFVINEKEMKEIQLQDCDKVEDKCEHFKNKANVIEMPCKVGDTVYVVSQGQGFNCRWGVYEGKVVDIHLNRHNELTIRVENGEKFFGYYKPCFIHKTEAEAEKALKEREQNE